MNSLLKLYQGRALGDGHGFQGSGLLSAFEPAGQVTSVSERPRPAPLDVRYDFHEGDSRRPIPLKKGLSHDQR